MNTVFITGANRGIGLELVKQYYQSGWQVIAGVRDLHSAQVLDTLKTSDDKNRLHIVTLDVTNKEHIQHITQQIQSFSIDILINNAGVWGPQNKVFGTLEVKSWLDVLAINSIAPLLIAQALIKQIERSELKIIANMSSDMGSIENNTEGGEYIYRSSKAALNSITKSLAIDLRNRGVTVISLHPGWVRTDMGGSNALITPEESVKGIRNVLRTVSLQESGRFIQFDGTTLAW